jgi:hypothetical protein
MIQIKPGTLGDQWQPMTIQLDADFAVGDRQCIGYHTDANDGTG